MQEIILEVESVSKSFRGVKALDRVSFDLREVRFHDSTQARDAGIGIIYQELNLIPHLSVAANIFIGREPLTRLSTLNERKMNAEAVAVLGRLGRTDGKTGKDASLESSIGDLAPKKFE